MIAKGVSDSTNPPRRQGGWGRVLIAMVLILLAIAGAYSPYFFKPQTSEARAQAQPQAPTVEGQVAADWFEYPLGEELSGKARGTGWGSAWDGKGATVADGGMTMGLKPSDGHHAVTGNGAIYESRMLGFTLGEPNTTEWISLVLQPNTPDNYGGLVIPGAKDSHGLFIGRSDYPPSPFWVMENNRGGGTQASKAKAVVAQPTLLVVRLDFSADSTRASLFVNPSLDTDPTSPDAVKEDNNLGLFDTIQLSSDGQVGFYRLRFGPTFQSVVRENNP